MSINYVVCVCLSCSFVRSFSLFQQCAKNAQIIETKNRKKGEYDMLIYTMNKSREEEENIDHRTTAGC